MMLSDDLKHDGFAVNRFIEKAIEHLKGKDIPNKKDHNIFGQLWPAI